LFHKSPANSSLTTTRQQDDLTNVVKYDYSKSVKIRKIEIVRGSGNVFRDLGHASPDVEQLKAVLATEIIKMLDRQGISVRAAHAQTGIAAADFSRIRNADLGRFTLDRLLSIINRLGSRVEVRVKVRAVLPVAQAVSGA
jgi:predicted XRE-type DNA-binding protein